MLTNEETTQQNPAKPAKSLDDPDSVGSSGSSGRSPEFDPGDWKSRIIVGRSTGAEVDLPGWLDSAYETLREQVMHPAYPCFFGTTAERRGEMFYSFVSGHDKNIRDLPATMQTFAKLATLPQYRKNNIAVFFEPDTKPLSHDEYHELFWKTLQHLHDVDPDPAADQQPEPSHEEWEFSFAGVQMFVVCACPSFKLRHSRNLGPGMVLLFQPRSVFVDTITNKVIGREARNQVRKRLETWDETPAHPDLGFYGDAGNLEWKQYFLDDKNVAAQDVCPFLKRQARKNLPGAIAAKPEVAVPDAQDAKPAGGGLQAVAQTYATLPPEKRAAFRLRLRERGMSGDQLPIVALGDRSGRFPLSPAQERLWFLWQLDPDDASYNLSGALRLEGSLHIDKLRAALAHVVQRHEVLRTRFMESDGQAWQVVGEAGYGWTDIDSAEASPLEGRLQALSLQPFDLTRGPLLRVALLSEATGAHVLHVSMHHIISDHASVKLLLDEFIAAYEQLCNATAPTAEPLPVQYGDYAAWQKEWAVDGENNPHHAYWVRQLGGTQPVLELPVVRSRGGVQTMRNARGARVSVSLDAVLARSLKQAAASHQTTLFTLLLSAYAVLLSRYSGQKDMRIGVAG